MMMMRIRMTMRTWMTFKMDGIPVEGGKALSKIGLPIAVQDFLCSVWLVLRQLARQCGWMGLDTAGLA